MSESELLQGGLELLVNGLGTVFVFLVTLIFGTKAMSAIVSKFPDKEESTPKKAVIHSQTDDLQQIAVAAAAVQAYKSRT